MRLSSLITPNKALTLRNGDDREITDLCTDSRKAKTGDLFIAIPGTQQNGLDFAQEAIHKGATALIVPTETPACALPTSVAVIETRDPRACVSDLAARFYAKAPRTIAAITGTSGKTSTALFTRQIWKELGHTSASLGTLGLVSDAETSYGSLTTPDPITLHQTLNRIANQGVTHLAMEASSHGIVLHRLDHVDLSCAAFTNLSRDHLDYHKDMADYFTAKKRLFSELLGEGKPAVLNADSAEFNELKTLCATRRQPVISYGNNGDTIRLLSFKPLEEGQHVCLDVNGRRYDLLLPIVGSFQVWNAQAALGLALACGADTDTAVEALTKLSGVPGRLEWIGTTPNGGAVFVDYAHKPDALTHVLTGLRPHVDATKGHLHVVFGCGGNRDKGKRPLMGEIATRLADVTIITDDNPRKEQAAEIRKEILAGCRQDATYTEIGDRATAIAQAIEALKKGDVLVIAGKGHEDGQIVGDQVLPFNDATVARSCLAALNATGKTK